MKCAFTVTDNDPIYLHMAKTLVVTARLNSKVDMYCLYDGESQEFTSWLARWGVSCIRWRIPFFDELRAKYTGRKSIDYCAGAYLCLEIPRAFKASGIDDPYVLYIDVDTMILGDLMLGGNRPSCFAAPPDWDITDWSFVSAGVMVLNMERVRQDYGEFIEHLLKHNFDFAFAGHGPCSQGAWNTFYANQWNNLEPEYDWKPWWGFNPLAKIVHFSGPKPEEVLALLNEERDEESMTERQKINRFVVQQNPESYRKYLQLWRNYEKLKAD